MNRNPFYGIKLPLSPVDLDKLAEQFEQSQAMIEHLQLENTELKKRIDRMRGRFVKRRCNAEIVKRWYHYADGKQRCSFYALDGSDYCHIHQEKSKRIGDYASK